ncbi:GAF domain-containing sensor histidine kinase [Gemmatimonas sp.]|uniref:sensor histidine kinase n=1 Tax=Gemmatimonas sp. TaxID=1962908 RepID=UPI0022CD1AEF|nr:GAF domain-containing sensor histidine kinase [Gemmatimonas sp.]MCZ8203920.1 GAF domain-containing sensor histidine kinase [Gemmatimonas sp.]
MHSPSPPPRLSGGHAAIDPADFPASNQDLLYSDYRKTEELGTLRQVARALAAETDSHKVLETLCQLSMVRGRASGASVAQLSGDNGVYVAVAGKAQALLDISFPLEGTMTGRVAREHRTLSLASPSASSPFFATLLPTLGVGPILLLPLLANQQLFGVLSITRDAGHPLFDDIDEERLGVMADLAALAIWKARLLEEARSADAAKTSLLAMLSHELRTPLTALEGYGELLEDEILGPLTVEQRDVIVRLRTVGRHLGSLIEDILTYASLEADRLTARTAPLRVDELMDSLHPFLEPLAREKGVAFAIELEPALPPLVTDEARLRQILLNLCQNAIKFTEVGAVTVRVSRGSPAADGSPTTRFAVRDTGVGIAATDMQRLFRPFSQLADSATRRARGTGLGLYIARRLATLLGGRIELVSRPGEGSTFTLVLPQQFPTSP